MYKIQHGYDADIMNGIFRKRNMSYNTKNSYGIETRNIKTVNYGSETFVYLAPKIWELLQKMKNSENKGNYKSDIKLWKSDDCPCRWCILYLP